MRGIVYGDIRKRIRQLEGCKVVRSTSTQEKKATLLAAAKGAIRRRIPRKRPSLSELFDADWYRKGFQANEVILSLIHI